MPRLRLTRSALLLLTLLLASFFPVQAVLSRLDTSPRVIVTASHLNVREGPSVRYQILGVVDGWVTEMPIIGRNEDWSWWQVESPYGVGWVSAQWTIIRGDASNTPLAEPDPNAVLLLPRALVTASYLNVREGPSARYQRMGAVEGWVTEMEIIGRNKDWSWWQVNSPFGVGWVSARWTVIRGDARFVPFAEPGAEPDVAFEVERAGQEAAPPPAGEAEPGAEAEVTVAAVAIALPATLALQSGPGLNYEIGRAHV